MSVQPHFNRRSFIKTALAGAGAVSLAACGNTPSSNKKTTVKYWDWYVTQGPWVANEVKLFQNANPDIEVKRTVQVADKYAQLLSAAHTGNNMPDVYQIPYDPGFVDQVKNGWLKPISDYPDYQTFADTFPHPTQNFIDGSNIIGGKTYSAPFEGPGPDITLWINTKVFKDAGLVDDSGKIKAPTTFAEMLEASRTIKQKLGGQNVYGYGFGGKLPYHDYWLLQTRKLSGGGSDGGFNMKTGKFDFATNPAYKEALEWFVKMRDEHHIIPDSSSVDDEQIRFLFSQHRFGMLLAGIWVINGWQQTSPNFHEYTMVHPPLYGGKINASYSAGPGGTNWGISKKTKESDAAWKWYKWLQSKEAGERWVQAGNGISIFPDALKTDNITNEALKSHVEQARTLVHIWPQVTIRNPNVTQEKDGTTRGNNELVRGVYTGQITNIAGELQKFQDEKQKAREQGVKDAQNAGLDVKLEDWAFPDWDPTKDYVTEVRVKA